MGNIIVWELPDGSVVVTHPAGTPLEGETEKVYLARVAAQSSPGPEAVRLADIPLSALPDRSFRVAWRHSAGDIIIDPALELAERWRRIRSDRDARLTASDKAILRAMDQGAKVAEWKAYRQALRDVPNQPDPKAITWPATPA
jgi:hypothetical protein